MKKTYLFMMFFITSFFFIPPLHVRWLLPYMIKNNSREGLSSSTTNHSPCLDQCNWKIKLITHLCCPFRTNYRSSHQRYSMKKGVFRNLTKLTGKDLYQSHLKKRLWYKCFPVSFVKFLRIPFLQNASGRLLLQSFGSLQASVL